MKKYLLSASLGVTVGITISLFFSALFAEGHFYPVNPKSTAGIFYSEHLTDLSTMLIAVVIWASIGVFFRVADKIFETSWSLLKMTVLHFVTTVIGFTGLAIPAGWFPLSLSNLLFFWAIFVLIYAIIYGINYHQMKKTIASINQQLG